MVFGISPDSPKTQAGFQEKQKLPFHLLSDGDKAVAQAYGAWQEKIVRSTFLIGEDGVIRKVWPKVKPEGHAAEVLAALGASAGANP